MAHFYRDQILSNHTITEELLIQISSVFESREVSINSKIPADDKSGKKAFLNYVIRFDGKGYRLFSLDNLLMYFRQGKDIERIIFAVETGESLRSGRQVGTYIELRFDEREPNNCYLVATSDDKDWVESSFSTVQDLLAKSKNKNSWARTQWTHLGVQILGVSLGFIISLWAAAKISPKLSIENSFLITFIFALLIFSNTWAYLNKKIISIINTYFPNIKFYRPTKDRMHWFMQAIIGGIAVAITLYILNLLFTYVGNILGSLVNKGV